MTSTINPKQLPYFYDPNRARKVLENRGQSDEERVSSYPVELNVKYTNQRILQIYITMCCSAMI